MRYAVILILTVGWTATGFCQQPVPLWPDKVPSSDSIRHPPRPLPPKKGTVLITDVTDPLITAFTPTSASNNGAGVIVCPGGGNKYLSIVSEGEEIGKWLAQEGFTAFVLQYRVPDNRAGALQDLQRAIRLVRSRAAGWQLDPNRVGVMGFSAGGNLSARASTNYRMPSYAPVDKADSFSCRPDFAVLLYPGSMATGPQHQLIPELTVDKETPPSFLFVANDDPVGLPLPYAAALHDAKVPMELHVCPTGGHGYGMNKPGNAASYEWPPLAVAWIRQTLGLQKNNASTQATRPLDREERQHRTIKYKKEQ